MLDAQSKYVFRCNLKQIANALCALCFLFGLREEVAGRLGVSVFLFRVKCALLLSAKWNFHIFVYTLKIREMKLEFAVPDKTSEKYIPKNMGAFFRHLKCFSSSSNVHFQTHKD